MKIYEILLVGVLAVLIGGPFWVSYRSKDKTLFWSPLTMFAGVFSYYFLIGPLIALGFGTTSFYGIEFRPMMWKPWLAGLLGLGSIYLGFAIRTKQFRARLATGLAAQQRRRLGWAFAVFLALGLLGFGYVTYTSGQSLLSMLLPVHSGAADIATAEREGFAAGNYVFLLINLFIPGICLLVALTAERPLIHRIFIIGAPVLIVMLFYTSIGFRHRIVVLLVSLAATAHLLRGKRPSPVVLLVGAASIVLLSGLIVLTRSYGMGLDLTQIKDLSFLEIFLGGFNDAGTFFTTALVIDSFPGTFAYVGLNPLWIAVTIPVPRSLWPGKPLPDFLQYFEYLMGTQGQAVPVVGEHYMMAGWIGIVIGGLIIGIIYRCFWEFYRANPRNPLVVVMYAVSWALIFPVVNRGYLAQTLMEFFFDFLPLVVLYLSSRKLMLAARPRLSAAMGPSRRTSVSVAR
jgi:hypothetical protein